MKRTYVFRGVTLFLFVRYFALLTLSFFIGEIDFYQFWFSGFLVALGLSNLTRFLCYKIDSSLYLGAVLTLFGACGVLNYYFSFNVALLIALYLGGISLASLSIFIVFRQKFHLKVFAFFALCAILLVLYSEKLLALWAFISLISVCLIFALIGIIFSIKSNTRKV